MKTNAELLKPLVDEIDDLISHKVSSSETEFKVWKSKTERTLIKIYGENSYEYKEFKQFDFTLPVSFLNTPHDDYVQACIRDLRNAKGLMSSYLDELNEQDESINTTSTKKDDAFKEVFIVHGHNDELKEAVARLIEKQGITAIILNELPNMGRTIIEKIEDNSDVGAAVCLFTADDTGKSVSDSNDSLRARQNVVFEAGYFIGKLSRKRVITIVQKGIEIPSDLQGIVYTPTNNWRIELIKELDAIGYEIDFSKI